MLKIKHIKRHYHGIFICLEDIKKRVEQQLSKYQHGSFYLSCFNGQGLWVKENGKVRDSTMSEWKTYHSNPRKWRKEFNISI